ncbi:carcinoembryonic antigen-related cell adhesion molecule 5-like isoform X2 [Periophthalmus magnuspinnatus]|uniref:carcinoembryonic antigen-related cell adhesion molecule 5-like isoform X2 n=1 Tax=Periophthalmus magnuspinnatus TaxID=409849 RepID=UPI002436F62F|nr:carcinoembryonic antigen-related cell adhesion molecule 5-like isoform X2 [Periophthalmus magnuspinnatus]
MGLLTVFCGISVAFLGLVSGAGVLPDSVDAALGGTVMFTTSLAPTQTPFISISWSTGTKNIISSNAAGGNFTGPEYEGRITLFISTGSLELRNVALSDTGQYSVNIVTGDGPTLGSILLNVYEPVSNVRVTVNSSDLVEFNSSVTLSCSADGANSTTFLWLNGSTEVTASDRVHLTDGGATLTITTVGRYDQGPFTCKVSNPVSSSISDPEQLFINYGPDGPILSVSPLLDYYEEGSDVSLSCSADSRPAAQFKWLLNGTLLSFTGAQMELKTIQTSQSGNYSCQAFNNKTLRYTTSQPASISVLGRITNIHVESSSNEPIEGASVNITCDASGSIFTRKWLINEQELNPSENIVFYEQKRVLSLRVLNRKDSGKYVCEISNPISTQTTVYTLSVIYGPENVQISGPEKIQVKKTLKLTCFSDSVPAANYTWIKNGTVLTQSSEYIKSMAGSSDSGQYICRASNEITKKTSEAAHTLLVTAPSGCSAGCIVGIVFGCIALALVVFAGVFFFLRKKKLGEKSNSRTDGGGQDNSAYAQNQEVNYADIKFVRKDGGAVHLSPPNQTEYAEVQKRNDQPASRLPTYNDHVKRVRRPPPMPPTTGTEYAEIRRK